MIIAILPEKACVYLQNSNFNPPGALNLRVFNFIAIDGNLKGV